MGVLTGLVMIAALFAAIHLICGQYSLIPGLDFGCGQYYYTDIPGWERYFSNDARPSAQCLPACVAYVPRPRLRHFA